MSTPRWIPVDPDRLGEAWAPLTTPWSIPAEVEAGGERIFWRGEQTSRRVGAPAAHLLTEFTRVGDGSAEDIAAFAREWGVLRLCAHGLPATHQLRSVALDHPQQSCELVPAADRAGWFGEPTAVWRKLARDIGVLTRAIDALRREEPVQRLDWYRLGRYFDEYERDHSIEGRSKAPAWREVAAEELLKEGVIGPIRLTVRRPDDPNPGPHRIQGLNIKKGEELNVGRRWVGYIVERWMQMGGVGIGFSWEKAEPELSFGSGTLVGAIAVQLTFAAAGERRFGMCKGCACLFHVSRASRLYCDACGDAADRTAMATLRSKPAEQRQDGRSDALRAKSTALETIEKATGGPATQIGSASRYRLASGTRIWMVWSRRHTRAGEPTYTFNIPSGAWNQDYLILGCASDGTLVIPIRELNEFRGNLPRGRRGEGNQVLVHHRAGGFHLHTKATTFDLSEWCDQFDQLRAPN